MPLVDASGYRCPWYWLGPHGQTILPNLSRRRIRLAMRRERLELPDGDFLDLDFFARPSQADPAHGCLLLLHGLEGSSSAPYVKSLAWAALRRGWQPVALNLRGCSGELNRLPRFYHSGEIGDLEAAITYLARRYECVALAGFSLGGNVALQYLGTAGESGHPAARAAIAFSAPVDLAASAERLAERSNAFYMKRFIRLLSDKLEAKAKVFPADIDPRPSRSMRSFHEFDGAYTAPLNGFASAQDYWERSSSLPRLAGLRRPALLLSALNDPFLSPSCFPEALARSSSLLHGCFPRSGGHMGFPGRRLGGAAWHERVGLDFLETALSLPGSG